MHLGLEGKFALVTGGSYGIGRAIAVALAREGCHVAICARGRARLDEAVVEIESQGVRALGIAADVRYRGDVERVVEASVAAWGTMHVLVNNAGGGGGRVGQSVEDVEDDVWTEAYVLNARAATWFTMLVLPHMRRQRWGRVVTITSLQGHEAGGRPWYNMAKSAETGLMKTLALDPSLVRDGLTFNCIAPGAVIHEGNEWDSFRREAPQRFADAIDRLPLGRLSTPEEIANVAVFACSERAALLNGTSIPVDGGQSRSF